MPVRAIFPVEEFEYFKGNVYEPSDDSYLLVEALQEDLAWIKETICPKICVEVGSGSGIVITSIAKEFQDKDDVNFMKFYATDINHHAIEATKKCLQLNEVSGVHVIHTNLVDGLRNNVNGNCDLLVTNPPFEPSEESEIGDPSVKCSWAAGTIGRAIIDKLIPELDSLMSEKGAVYITMVEENNINEVIDQMKIAGFGVHKIVKEKKSGKTSSFYGRIYHQYIIRFTRA